MDPTKSFPINCVIGGQENSQNYNGTLYIGRKLIGNEMVIGKIIESWKSGYCKHIIKFVLLCLMFLSVPYHNVEHWSDQYEVLCGSTIQPNWFKKGSVAVSSQDSGSVLNFWICRGAHEGSTIPGKFYEPTGCCYVPSNGKEVCLQDYELMVSI